MGARPRLVIDTNTFVSRLLVPNSTPGRAVRKALDSAHLLASEATMNELADVLSRPKFDAYISLEDRQQFIRLLARVVEMVSIVRRIHVCRDPKDDQILELAFSGAADLIVACDRDLLALKTFQEIPIISPAAYLGK